MMKQRTKRILVTGGAGFIGSAFIRTVLRCDPNCEKVVNYDLLTYAGRLENVKDIADDPRYFFMQGDICNEEYVTSLCKKHQITSIVHFAAESHVDRSILGPLAFCKTNVEGTLHLLEVVRRLPHIHFHHISTDEVFGSLEEKGLFTETSLYHPNSPYSASKAASDHFVKAYAHTYGLSTTMSHCSNNYGPYQHEEKFIPTMILCAARKQPLPVYGNGMNVRDWLYVEDHAEAIWTILTKASAGSCYNIGGECERKNIDLLQEILQLYCAMEEEEFHNIQSLITYVQDRPGHDLRYAIDATKIKEELGWRPKHNLQEGLRLTIQWYLNTHVKNQQEAVR